MRYAAIAVASVAVALALRLGGYYTERYAETVVGYGLQAPGLAHLMILAMVLQLGAYASIATGLVLIVVLWLMRKKAAHYSAYVAIAIGGVAVAATSILAGCVLIGVHEDWIRAGASQASGPWLRYLGMWVRSLGYVALGTAAVLAALLWMIRRRPRPMDGVTP